MRRSKVMVEKVNYFIRTLREKLYEEMISSYKFLKTWTPQCTNNIMLFRLCFLPLWQDTPFGFLMFFVYFCFRMEWPYLDMTLRILFFLNKFSHSYTTEKESCNRNVRATAMAWVFQHRLSNLDGIQKINHLD